MGSKKTLFFAAFVLLSVFSAFVMAAVASPDKVGGQGEGQGLLLGAREQQLGCRVDFESSVTKDVASALPSNSQLISDSAKLGSDKSQLASLASAGDANAFESFVQGTLVPDMKSNAANLRAARGSFKDNNVTNETRQKLKADFDSYSATMKTCEQSAISAVLQARINQYENDLDSWNSKITNRSGKGFSTSDMQQVISGASAVLDPLKAALSSGDSAKMKSALQTYCLRDACDGDKNASIAPYNYHLAARMAIALADAEYSRAAALSANVTGVPTTSLDSAKQKIDDAKSILAQVGTAKYSGGEDEQITSDLKQAAQDLRDYAQSVRAFIQQQRQNARGNRTAAGGNRTGAGGNRTGGAGPASGRFNRTGANGRVPGGANGGTPPGGASPDAAAQ